MSDNIKTRRQIDEIDNANASDEHKSKKFKEDPEQHKDNDDHDSRGINSTQSTQTMPEDAMKETLDVGIEETPQEMEINNRMGEVLDCSECLSNPKNVKQKASDHFQTTSNTTAPASRLVTKTGQENNNDINGSSGRSNVESNSTTISPSKKSNTPDSFTTCQSSNPHSCVTRNASNSPLNYAQPSTSTAPLVSTSRTVPTISRGRGFVENYNQTLPFNNALPTSSIGRGVPSNRVGESSVSSGSMGRGGALSHNPQGNQGLSNYSTGSGAPFLPMNYDVPLLPVNQGLPVLPVSHGLPFLSLNNNVPYIPLISGVPFVPICHGVPVVPSFHTMPVAQVSRGVQVPPLGGGLSAQDALPGIPVQASSSHTVSSATTGNNNQAVTENNQTSSCLDENEEFKPPLGHENQPVPLEQTSDKAGSHHESQKAQGNGSPDMGDSVSGSIPLANGLEMGDSNQSLSPGYPSRGLPVCPGLNYNHGLGAASANRNISATRGFPLASIGRGYQSLQSGRGFQAIPVGRGFQAVSVGRGFRAVPVGRGFQAVPRGRGFQAVPRGRGFQAIPMGRGFQADPIGRGFQAGEAASGAPIVNEIQAGCAATAGRGAQGHPAGLTGRGNQVGPAAPSAAGRGNQVGPAAPSAAGRGIVAGPAAPAFQGIQAGPVVGRGLPAPLAGRGLPLGPAGRGFRGGAGGRGFPMGHVGRGFLPAIFGRGFPALPIAHGFHGVPAGRGLNPAPIGQAGRGYQAGSAGRGTPVAPLSHRGFVPVGHGFPAAEGHTEPDPLGIPGAQAPPVALPVEPVVAGPQQNDAPPDDQALLPGNPIPAAGPANQIQDNVVPMPGPIRNDRPPLYYQIRVQEPITPGRTIPAVAIPVYGAPQNAQNAQNEALGVQEAVPFGPVYSVTRPLGNMKGNDEFMLVPSTNIYPQNNFFIQMIQNLMKRDTYPDLNSMLNATMERDYMEFVNRVMDAKIRNSSQGINDGMLLYLSCPGSLEAKKQIIRYCVGVVLPDYEIDEDVGEHTAIVEALVDAGANVNVTSLSGETPLHKLAKNGPLSSAQVLIDAGGDHYRRDKRGRTPLYIAASAGRNNFVEEFIDVGSEVSAAAKDLSTPLHAAALGGYAETVRHLLIAGANRNAKDKHGVTPPTASTNMIVNMIFARRQEDLKLPITSEEIRIFREHSQANAP